MKALSSIPGGTASFSARTVALLTLLASGQEALQYLNADRHPSLIDVLINTAGGVTCLALRLLLDRRAAIPPGDALEESA